MARRVAELARGFLLQGRGGEGRCGIAALRLALDGADQEASTFERVLQPRRARLIGDIEFVELLAVGGNEACLEGLVLGGRELGGDRPRFLRLELLDLELAVADEPERHGLDAAGRSGARKLAPQDRRQREADEIVERAAGEIGVDQRPVDRARVAHGVEHRLLGHGVEHDALDGDAGERFLAVEDLQHVPGDGLALTVGVGGEDQLIRALDGACDLVEPLRRLGIDVPMHGEVLLGLDRAILGRQVAHMAVGGDHVIIRPEILVDGLCLGWRFDDDDVH